MRWSWANCRWMAGTACARRVTDGSHRPAAKATKRIFVPQRRCRRSRLIPGLEVIPVATLAAVVRAFDRRSAHPTAPARRDPCRRGQLLPNRFPDIKGQEHVKRALEVAAAGGHNILMVGPPGAGKTLLARALPAILPRMTIDEALDVTRIYSVADLLPPDIPLMRNRPFRAPHHTICLPDWSAAETTRTRVKFRLRTAACCFWMSCPSSAPACWRCCASRWKTRSSPSAARARIADLSSQFSIGGGHEPLPVRVLW